MRRTQPITKKANISSTTHVQLLQLLYGKQQQQHIFIFGIVKTAYHTNIAHYSINVDLSESDNAC